MSPSRQPTCAGRSGSTGPAAARRTGRRSGGRPSLAPRSRSPVVIVGARDEGRGAVAGEGREGLGAPAQALLAVALDFACWRVVTAALDSAGAAELMSEAVSRLD